MIDTIRAIFATPTTMFPASQVVACDAKGTRSWAALCARIDAWEQAFAGVDAERVALYVDDSWDFSAALFALWRCGKQAVIPGNNLPATCAQLSDFTPCFAGDLPGAQVPCPAFQAQPVEISTALSKLVFPAPEQPALVMFTSGSAGSPQPVSKTFAQVDAELATLESRWGVALAGATISSSVSHHHIYGLFFRLLWPLCAGRPFVIPARDYWEELANDARHYRPLAIISSPAHLSRIPPLAWPAEAAPALILSSGAPLAAAASLAAKAQLGCAVTEVYGSTETGGIAWREQDQHSNWTCLPGVEVALDGDSLLQVRSPHLGGAAWFTTSDRASLDSDGRFSLCGRADRIAKVGGKRISLSAIEQLLEQQPGVAHARVLPLPERGDRLGAVIVLDNQGNNQLVDLGKSAINLQLKTALENAVDRVAIPRYWRYLNELPRNRQGKTTQAELAPLFGSDELPRLPEVVARRQEGDSQLLDLFIPANLYYFEGHFPGRPVLPGVVQTHWAVHYGREHWGDLGEFSALEAIKFQQVVSASQMLTLRLEWRPSQQAEVDKLYFAYTSGAAVAHASGRIVFRRGAR